MAKKQTPRSARAIPAAHPMIYEAEARMVPEPGRTVATVVLAILVPLGTFLFLGVWFSDGHGASLSRLAQVHPGMTRKQVVSLLGRPGTINQTSNGSESWFYTKWTFCQVKVFMSSEGLVSETDHDH